MEITLTPAQWKALYPLVAIALKAERKLGLPIDIDNGNQQIEIKSDEVKITLED